MWQTSHPSITWQFDGFAATWLISFTAVLLQWHPPIPFLKKNQLQVRLLDWVIESNTKTLTFAAHCGSVWESPNYNVARKWKLGYNLDFLCMKAIMSCIHSSESQHSSSKAHSFLLAPCDKLWNESRINCLENNKDC